MNPKPEGQQQDPDSVSAGMQRVDRFDLLTELGRGGLGVVWLARDRDSGERIALKVLTHLGPGCDRALRRFQREASIVADFDHPGICRIVDTGISDGVPWIAMPFIQGESLQSFIARSHQQEATLTIADPNAAATQNESSPGRSAIKDDMASRCPPAR